MTEDIDKLMQMSWAPSDTIALALSGGIDSMILYHILTDRDDTYRKLVLLHVNHGMRPESADEENYIRRLASRNGHTVEVAHLSMAGDFSQAKARTLRYRFFKEQCKRHDAAVLLTAHHLDDHHETILHQLLTGRHLNDTLGIKAAGTVDGLPVARPLSAVSRQMIKRYQNKHHIHYFEDETNAEDGYTRNYIRHHIMPAIRTHEHLHETSLGRAAEDMDELKGLARLRASEFISHNKGGDLERDALNGEPHIIKVFIIQQWLSLHGIHAGRKFIEELLAVSQGDASQSDLHIGGKTVKLRYGRLFIDDDSVKHVRLMDEDLLITGNGTHHYNGYRIDVDLPRELLPLAVRPRMDGDVMRLPNVGRKKLSRIFIDNKVPREERGKIPVIVDKRNEIIALGTIYNIIEPQENYNGLNISKEKAHEPEE